MANVFTTSVLLCVFIGMLYLSSAAPVKNVVGTEEGSEQDINTEKEQADKSTDSETEALSTTEKTPSSADDGDDPNKEVTNYHSIEVDGNSKLEEPETIIGEEETPVLSEEDAQELLLELSSPSDVAQMIVASDDAAGFLDALRLLTDQDYISLSMAYYLRDRVMDELRRMLMIQEMELSRTLLNNYDDFSQEQLPNSEPAAPYYDDVTTYVTEDDIYPQVPYELYEESLRQENTQALAEIAEAVAQKIAAGELTSENGVKIMNTVAGLLPDSYWEDALQVFADSEDTAYIPEDSDYSQGSIGSDVTDLLGDEDEGDSEDNEDQSTEVDHVEIPEEELEEELKNKNKENTLEKQLVSKAHLGELEATAGDDIVPVQNTIVDQSDSPAIIEIDQPELSGEDYQAFFDWLQNAMLNAEGDDGALQEPVLVKEDDETPSTENSAETNQS